MTYFSPGKSARMSLTAVELPRVKPERLRAAIEALMLVGADAPESLGKRLETGARAVSKQTGSEPARNFQALLEVGYLVASADGFADEERAALARLLEHATARAVSHDVLELHFRDLDESAALLGRAERLLRAASDIEEAGAKLDALRFAGLVALSDGQLGQPEVTALYELAGGLSLSETDANRVIKPLVDELEHALRD
jgi:tellurite resistance protein